MNPKHSDTSVEHYTPSYIVEAAREALGGRIDLDPCSCEFANRVVEAEKFYTHRGQFQYWYGNMFVNPPGGLYDVMSGVMVYRKKKGRPSCGDTGLCGLPVGHTHLNKDVVSSAAYWWNLLSNSVEVGIVKRAIFIGFSIEIVATSQGQTERNPLDYLHCVPRYRIPFDTNVEGERVSGSQPTHNNIIVGLGDIDPQTFKNAFGSIGGVWKGERL